MPRLFLCSLFVCWGATLVAPAFAQETAVKWERIKFEDAFRAEGVAVGDFNQDGRLDITNGEAWYEAPGDANLYKTGNWTMRQIRPEGVRRFHNDNGYSQSFAVWSYDISGDGWLDIIVIGFPGVPCHWFENPQKQPGPWNQYEIWHSAAGESPQFLDVTGDGKPELVMTSEPEQMMGYLEIPSPEMAKKKWDYKQVSGEKLGGLAHRYYHGLGAGDLNRDGKQDILIPAGWWEQ
ncbi:MAG: VCBS repeat-containing protein, partial [Candidatus Saccharimonas sp.]|nr:VCBS repeat-containing protein [Planctomycetaceae bacterium]